MVSDVLVAYPSKYGTTKEIAEKIGEVSRQAGLQVDVLPSIASGTLTNTRLLSLAARSRWASDTKRL